MSDELEKISVEVALAQVADGADVHTFLNPNGILVGTDWPRAEVEKLIRDFGGAYLTGPLAEKLGHGLAVEYGGRMVFIATKGSK